MFLVYLVFVSLCWHYCCRGGVALADGQGAAAPTNSGSSSGGSTGGERGKRHAAALQNLPAARVLLLVQLKPALCASSCGHQPTHWPPVPTLPACCLAALCCRESQLRPDASDHGKNDGGCGGARHDCAAGQGGGACHQGWQRRGGGGAALGQGSRGAASSRLHTVVGQTCILTAPRLLFRPALAAAMSACFPPAAAQTYRPCC